MDVFDLWKSSLEGTSALVRMWTDLAAGTLRSGEAADPDDAPPDAFRKMRSAMLGAWADAWDRFVRTPEFLDWMRVCVSGGARGCKQMLDFVGQVQQQFLGAGCQGLDQAMAATRQLQGQVVDGLEVILAQLKQLGGRMDALETEMAQTRKPRREKPRKHAVKNGKS